MKTKLKKKIKNKIMKINNNLKKNSNLNIYREKGFLIFSKILDLKIFGGRNYQTFPENPFNLTILEKRFQTFLVNSILVDCGEHNQTSLRNTPSYLKE